MISGDIDPVPSYNASGAIAMGACHQFVRAASFSPHVCAFELRCHRSEPNGIFRRRRPPSFPKSKELASYLASSRLLFNFLTYYRYDVRDADTASGAAVASESAL